MDNQIVKKTGKRIAKVLARSMEKPGTSFLVSVIEEDPYLPNGFTIQIHVLDKDEMKPIDHTDDKLAKVFDSQPKTIQELIRDFYRQKALAAFKNRLEEALQEI